MIKKQIILSRTLSGVVKLIKVKPCCNHVDLQTDKGDFYEADEAKSKYVSLINRGRIEFYR